MTGAMQEEAKGMFFGYIKWGKTTKMWRGTGNSRTSIVF
jgi:hypothetical protein